MGLALPAVAACSAAPTLGRLAWHHAATRLGQTGRPFLVHKPMLAIFISAPLFKFRPFTLHRPPCLPQQLRLDSFQSTSPSLLIIITNALSITLDLRSSWNRIALSQRKISTKMAPLAKTLAVVAALAAPALAAAASNLQARQYQDPNSQLVVNNPCLRLFTNAPSTGNQAPRSRSTGPILLRAPFRSTSMTNNNSEVAYNIGTAPAVSNTCDAGNGYGNPGSNGAQCGGFVFTVPSSWNAGNYSSLRAISVQNQDLQSSPTRSTLPRTAPPPTMYRSRWSADPR